MFVIIDRGNKIKDLQEQVEMQELYYIQERNKLLEVGKEEKENETN